MAYAFLTQLYARLNAIVEENASEPEPYVALCDGTCDNDENAMYKLLSFESELDMMRAFLVPKFSIAKSDNSGYVLATKSIQKWCLTLEDNRWVGRFQRLQVGGKKRMCLVVGHQKFQRKLHLIAADCLNEGARLPRMTKTYQNAVLKCGSENANKRIRSPAKNKPTLPNSNGTQNSQPLPLGSPFSAIKSPLQKKARPLHNSPTKQVLGMSPCGNKRQSSSPRPISYMSPKQHQMRQHNKSINSNSCTTPLAEKNNTGSIRRLFQEIPTPILGRNSKGKENRVNFVEQTETSSSTSTSVDTMMVLEQQSTNVMMVSTSVQTDVLPIEEVVLALQQSARPPWLEKPVALEPTTPKRPPRNMTELRCSEKGTSFTYHVTKGNHVELVKRESKKKRALDT